MRRRRRRKWRVRERGGIEEAGRKEKRGGREEKDKEEEGLRFGAVSFLFYMVDCDI